MHTIRRLTLGDVSAYRQLRLAALEESPSAFSATLASEQALSDAQFATCIAGASLSGAWGAWSPRQQLVGSAILWHQPREKLRHKASINGVYVEPSARGTGLAQQLLEAVLAHARQGGLRQLYLGVTAGNAPAQRLYTKLGFVEYGREPAALCVDGVYYDEVLMQLRLQNA